MFSELTEAAGGSDHSWIFITIIESCWSLYKEPPKRSGT